MKKNMSITDSIVRVFVAIAIAGFYFMEIVLGTMGFIILSISGLLVITSVFRYCPLYKILNMTTCKVSE